MPIRGSRRMRVSASCRPSPAGPSWWRPRAPPASWSARRPRPRAPTCRSPSAATFKARGTQVRFEGVELAIDPGGRALRLGGTGRLDLRQWRAGLTLEARRLDLDAFLASPEGQNLIARGLPRSAGGLPAMLDLDLAVGSAVLGGEDWSNLALTGTLERAGGLLLRRFSVVGPADSTVSASGQVETAPLRLTGPVALAAPDSEALGRYLRRLGLEGPLAALLDGRRVEAAADLSAAAAGLSLRNLRVALGTARITGNARYMAAEGQERGRFDAQIRASGLDIAGLPPVGDGARRACGDHRPRPDPGGPGTSASGRRAPAPARSRRASSRTAPVSRSTASTSPTSPAPAPGCPAGSARTGPAAFPAA